MNKKNIILLAILVVLIGIFFLSKTKENEEKRIKVFKYKLKDISQIQLIQPDYSLIIKTEGDVWQIKEPIETPVKETQKQNFLDRVFPLTTSSNPISEAGDRQKYNVDSTATQVKIYDKKDKLLSHIFIGRSQNASFAYLRADKSNKIYQIDNISNIVNPSLIAWRENKLVNATEETLDKISIGKATGTYEFVNNAGSWVINANGLSSQIEAGNQDFSRFLQSIVNLTITTFFDNEYEKYAEKFAETELELIVQTKTGETTHLKFAQNDENSYVIQKNDDEISLYRLNNTQFNQLNVDPDAFVRVGE
jgi:hypothetical protein